jgi:integrase
MSERHPTAPAPTVKPAKPSKPYPGFPLTAHPAGYWCKKIRGKLYYFGPWSDPDAALAKYLEQRDALHSGRTPRPDPEGVTVKVVCNAFLNHKQNLLDAGEIAPRTWAEYKQTCDILVSRMGKNRLLADLGPDDFAALRNRLAESWGPVRLANEIQRVRGVFKYALECGLVDRPMLFGAGFKRPARKVVRLLRAKQGLRMFEAEEIRRMLDAAGVQMKAMILLGVNGGLGNSDVGNLPQTALDLDGGWLNYPRPKTGVPRRCPLWAETIAALRAALAKRPTPKRPEHAGLVFVTKFGSPWFTNTPSNPLSHEVRKLLDALGINGRRNFYALRHTFETVGGEAKDQVAVDHVMGHSREDMASVYRERISDERLKAVTDHVHMWLFGEAAEAPADKTERVE